MVTSLTVDDLTPIEQTYLGVLSLGLVSADQARDSRFRMEYVCAAAHALRQGMTEDTYLTYGDHEATEQLRDDLRTAMIDLDVKRVIGIGPPQDLQILKPSVSAVEAYGTIDINRHPPIFDRFLAQRCMDQLLAVPAAHRFLMALYTDSSDIWGKLYEQGYGQYR